MVFAGACGGKVVVDHGGGGPGGSGGSSSQSGTSTGVGASSSSSSSVSSGGLTLCYMGSPPACQPCAQAATMGGPCTDVYEACVASGGECAEFGSCSGGCDGDQPCCDACAVDFPKGAVTYGAVLHCLACQACPADCADSVQPGFCP
ncbi:Hypothetical protein A7982_02325 [Minicystis rosea]|nr:Hypothetical protein A7982_02325 [Minicystis rosea]